MKYLYPVILSVLFIVVTFQPAVAQQEDLSLGTIDFPTSAEGEVQQEFLTGVLALHSFWYPEARDHFKRARELDPDFAMAYWGEALTHDHPLWGQHDQEAGAQVLEALDNRNSPKWNKRENAYIDAVRKLFEPGASMEERRNNYAAAMNSLSDRYPGDDEALVLSALTGMSVPAYNYNNPEVRELVPIAAKLEGLYKRNPEHPGAMHYLIHLYDNDKFAELGLRPANDYADVAYSSPHAIHMPSHIYRQLEKWDQVIEANIRAYDASVKWQQRTGRALQDRDFHSYRWLFEANLEIEEYQEACNMINNLRNMISLANEKGEEPGRIQSTLENFTRQYRQADAHSAVPCRE